MWSPVSWLRPVPERARLNGQWLVRLRWAQIVGQASTVLVVRWVLGVDIPLSPLSVIIGLGLLSNLWCEAWFVRRGRLPREGHLAGVMLLDVALLTSLLFFTGGPLNPFGFLYLVQIALATVLLRAAWAWALGAMSFLGFGVLLLTHRPLPISDGSRMFGMWVALGVAAAFIVQFLVRIQASLSAREAELAEVRNLTARQERLASMATMAAGAAHELATPLSTVALVAKELERALAGHANSQLADDARLIREQVGRCRGILDHMVGGAGTVGEAIEPRMLGDVLDEALTGVRTAPALTRDLSAADAASQVGWPVRAVSQTLRSLVTNAQDASPPEAGVTVEVACAPAHVVITIIDQGPGMPAEVLARVGEPFFTTKPPGRGMGMGLFLSRAVIEGIGGQLELQSAPGQGTRARVRLPRTVAPTGSMGPGAPAR